MKLGLLALAGALGALPKFTPSDPPANPKLVLTKEEKEKLDSLHGKAKKAFVKELRKKYT